MRWLTLICAWAALFAAAEQPPPSIVPDDVSDPIAGMLEDARTTSMREYADATQPPVRADIWGRLAMLYHAQSLFGAAAQTYERALTEAPNIRWRYLLGIALAEHGDPTGAVEAFSDVLREIGAPDADEEPGYEMLASFRLGQTLLDIGDHLGAQRALARALELSPDSAVIHAALADAAIAAGDAAAARRQLERAWAIEPEAGQVAYKLALLHRDSGDVDEALRWLQRRNDVAPSVDDPVLLEVARLSFSARFFMNAADRAWQLGNQHEALGHYRKAATLAPSDVGIGLALAFAHESLGETKTAHDEVLRVLDLDPQSARAWYLLAHVQRRDANVASARQATNRSLELADDPQTRALRAALSMRAGELEAAIADYDVLVRQHPDNPYFRYWSAMSRLRAHDCASAMELLPAVLDLLPSWGEAHVVSIRAAAICGDDRSRGSARVAASALVERQDNADTRLTLAYVQLALGETDAAHVTAGLHAAHPDAVMLLESATASEVPSLPFAPQSHWWVPSELR